MQLLIFLLVIITFFLFFNNSDNIKVVNEPTTTSLQENNSPASYTQDTNVGALVNPYNAPERLPPINNSSIVFNEKTRGEESYQLVGLLYNNDVNKNYQLFGRRTYPRSNEWEYYILGKDEGGLEIKFPLDTKQEIYNNTQVNIPLYNSNFTVKIYDYSLKYNPNVY